MIKYKKILSDIIQGKQHWTDLKPELSRYNIDNREAGIKDIWFYDYRNQYPPHAKEAHNDNAAFGGLY